MIDDKSSTTPPPPAATAPASDPAKKLDALKQQLKDTLTRIDNLTQQTNTLRTDIAALDKAVTEIKQTSQAYGQAYPNICKDMQDLKTYQTTKFRMVDCALAQADKDAIQAKVGAYDQAVQDQTTQVKSQQADRDAAAQKLQAAQAELVGAQKAYDGLRTAQRGLEDQVREMKAVRDVVDREEQNQHLKNMYFVVGELKNLLDQFNPIPANQYQDRLQQALDATNAATQKVREAKSKLDASQAALDAGQQTLNDMVTKRRDQLLKSLDGQALAAKA